MRVLVTGGAGFIGSHLCEFLVEQHHDVTVLDELSTGSVANLTSCLDAGSVRLVEGSILDRDLVDECVRGKDAVFHLAAAVGVQTIVNSPLQSLRVNLHGTENVVEAAVTHGVPIGVTSTSEVYGKNDADGLREDADRILGSPLLSRWSYAAAKGLDELVAHVRAIETGTPCVSYRLFNVVGPRQTGRYGMVLPRFVAQALSHEPITVYGDGTQRRCFGSVYDVVPAMVELLQTPAAHGRAVNLGGREEISIRGLAEKIKDFTGSTSDIHTVPYDVAYGHGFEDMARRMPDLSLAHELINYTARYDLDDIVQSVVADAQRAGQRDPLLTAP
ncbi:NAD-dependent epimerase/dehydratase family protein [Micromonospora endophytica]|uniref:Nucleoside-diphosphate sugar epimerase n=1 Tax=Micromonospora endophytica TaxID=515350 RepID=A0A2W2CCF9_9ACTN|nr:NAD-dependent epimerase/dehydratase family protein [Micromonospora endophytica]PZF97155.1 nucleoside-diphosphate sugar epimerase [Micromonospora endophytica]RIW46206.1 NAD-dependent epimerase/dehydratase family protein [Micromonospora endophytica]BCJ61704.1 nucleoside-diphosphate sugar epimerase [Micromonospora endophytica]